MSELSYRHDPGGDTTVDEEQQPSSPPIETESLLPPSSTLLPAPPPRVASTSNEIGSSLPAASRDGSTHTPADPETWKIHYTKPPGSSSICIGPLSWDDLDRQLGLGEDTVRNDSFSLIF